MRFEKELLQIGKEITARDEFLITAHFSPDGDNIGSCVAVYQLLKNMGKKAVIINEDPVPDKFRFLLGDDIVINLASDYPQEKFDNVIILDVGSPARIGTVKNFVAEEAFIINIDHHSSNPRFGDLFVVDNICAAAAQVVYNLIVANDFTLTKRIAEAIYVGILSDTGGFRYSNTDKAVMQTATALMEFDIDASDLMERTFHLNPFQQVLKAGTIIKNTELIYPGPAAILIHDQQTNPIQDNDLILELLNSVKEAAVILFIRVMDDNLIKTSFRSKTDFNVSDFAAKFGGGGHPKAAGLRFDGTLQVYKDTVLKQLEIELKEFFG